MIFLMILAVILAYGIGVLPTGLLIARAHNVDVTAHGSGNVGATNVARVVGKRAGVLTLIADVIKGILGTAVGGILIDETWGVGVGACAVVAGHCISIPGYLKGGKGIATALGCYIALGHWIAPVALTIFGVVIAGSRIVSLASLTAAVLIPVYSIMTWQEDWLSCALIVISAIAIYRHRQNVIRLIHGTEPRFGSGGSSGSQATSQ